MLQGVLVKALGGRIMKNDAVTTDDIRNICLQSLIREPMPLCSTELKLAVLWSAKAGCTFATKWFFYHSGLLEEAMPDGKGWVHEYRSKVFFKQPGYKKIVEQITLPSMRVVKFVRNPFERAVSSYLGYCQAAHRQAGGAHAKVLRGIHGYCGRPITRVQTFTFREFVGFLQSIDLNTCDIHFRIQTSPCERGGILPNLCIIRIEESATVLPGLEDQYGLRRSDLGSLRQSSHHALKSDNPGFFGDTQFIKTRGVDVPKARYFYDDALVADVLKIYKEDIERYSYPVSPF